MAPPGTAYRPVQIESVDHKTVRQEDVNRRGNFSFKVPEGQYKITITTESGHVVQRTIEVRQAFTDADDPYRITLKIELTDSGAPVELPKLQPKAKGSAAPSEDAGVSSKAAEELQRASDAKGNAKRAREHLEKALDIEPNYPEALDALGKINFQEKQFAKAVELYQKALTVNPDFYPARVDLGGVLLAMGDYERALPENSKAVEMRPDDSVAQSQLGQVLFRLNKYDEALKHLEIAKALDPVSYTLPGLYIAQIHQARGENAAAVTEYKEFLKNHPRHEFTGSIQNEIIFLEKQISK
jgi:tetratricopeptide (TPR) repeat protein